MGCCGSKVATGKKEDYESHTGLQPLKKDETQCETGETIRPASSTARESTLVNSNHIGSFSSFKGNKPSALNTLDCPAHHHINNPNALNITPVNGLGQLSTENKDRHEEDLNRLAMFIPWEKPALGSKGSTSVSKKKKPKLSGVMATPQAKKQDVTFIPGSGNEKILLSSKKGNFAELPPLSFKKVKGDEHLKSQIEKDREKIKRQKKKMKAALDALRHCFATRDEHSNEYTQMRNKDSARDIARLIGHYADLGVQGQTEFLVVSKEVAPDTNNTTSKDMNKTRVTISCPVRVPAS